MANTDLPEGQSKDVLPPIQQTEAPQYMFDRAEHKKSSLSDFRLANSTSSPPSTAPPPYSHAPPSTIAYKSPSDTIPPYEPLSRRSTKDEKELSKSIPSLPSIREALRDADVTASSSTLSTPRRLTNSVFDNAPMGPGNPFSQSSGPGHAPRLQTAPYSSSVTETSPTTVVPPPLQPVDVRASRLNSMPSSRNHTYARAPSEYVEAQRLSQSHPLPPSDRSRGYPYPDTTPSVVPPLQSASASTFDFRPGHNFDDTTNPFKSPHPPTMTHSEMIKRHLDMFQAEAAFKEIAMASSQLRESVNFWAENHYRGKQDSYYTEVLPKVVEVDEAIHSTQGVLHNLDKLRRAAVRQQDDIDEQRAHAAAKRQHEEEDQYEEYKGGDLGPETKKRRGKAAPPGRCHSCNRSETPEWRRGPDGARTLCNACGLHYAKLTRKVGASGAKAMTGSNLRPKGLSEAHQPG